MGEGGREAKTVVPIQKPMPGTIFRDRCCFVAVKTTKNKQAPQQHRQCVNSLKKESRGGRVGGWVGAALLGMNGARYLYILYFGGALHSRPVPGSLT